MKRKSIIVLFTMSILCSCSTDVDIYTDFKDTTIVYGVMDAAKDTNVINS